MPHAAPHACPTPGCREIVPAGHARCPAHRRELENVRGTAYTRGYNARWQKCRLAFLAVHPLCLECAAIGRTTAATVVDHIRAHKGDEQLFWDESNWRPLCKPHHDARTDEGDFGRT